MSRVCIGSVSFSYFRVDCEHPQNAKFENTLILQVRNISQQCCCWHYADNVRAVTKTMYLEVPECHVILLVQGIPEDQGRQIQVVPAHWPVHLVVLAHLPGQLVL